MTDLININKFLTQFYKLAVDDAYPFYNIKKVHDEHYVLEMALAGWKKSDVDVSVHDGVLSIKGKISSNADNYIHKGVAQRAFLKRLQLSEYVECTGAKLEDGMLKVELVYDPPEGKKPKKITVK